MKEDTGDRVVQLAFHPSTVSSSNPVFANNDHHLHPMEVN